MNDAKDELIKSLLERIADLEDYLEKLNQQNLRLVEMLNPTDKG